VLDFPVVSGNVSLYNETEGRAILPTPAIGGLGVLEDAATAVGLALAPWLDLVLIGDTRGWLGQSLWLREIAGKEEGAPPPVDLAAERRNGDFVRGQIEIGRVRACHDVSDGGLLVAIAEMAMAGGTGVRLSAGPRDIPGHGFWFGEDQGRYVLAVTDSVATIAAAEASGVSAIRIGYSGGQDLTLPDGGTISVKALRDAHERFFPAWMDAPSG
jgi:phosphoribosylformylglycinamidine synthase subunit PurL